MHRITRVFARLQENVAFVLVCSRTFSAASSTTVISASRISMSAAHDLSQRRGGEATAAAVAASPIYADKTTAARSLISSLS